MNYIEARKALDALGMSQKELGEVLGEITGKKYAATTVNKWFIESGPGPSDTCVTYLTMALRQRQRSELVKRDVLAYLSDKLPD